MSYEWSDAVAYIKRNLPKDGTPVVSVRHEDSPVFRDLQNGLLVAYLVDEEDSFRESLACR